MTSSEILEQINALLTCVDSSVTNQKWLSLLICYRRSQSSSTKLPIIDFWYAVNVNMIFINSSIIENVNKITLNETYKEMYISSYIIIQIK